MISETLDSLSKKELIGLVLAQVEQIAALQSRVAELEAKLTLHDSHFLRFQSVPAGKCVFGVVSEHVSEMVEADAEP